MGKLRWGKLYLVFDLFSVGSTTRYSLTDTQSMPIGDHIDSINWLQIIKQTVPICVYVILHGKRTLCPPPRGDNVRGDYVRGDNVLDSRCICSYLMNIKSQNLSGLETYKDILVIRKISYLQNVLFSLIYLLLLFFF